MNKIATVEELFKELNSQDALYDCPKWVKDLAIKFAKLHKNAALKSVVEKHMMRLCQLGWKDVLKLIKI